MSQAPKEKNIDSQIISYVSNLSDKNKEAVLTVVKSMSEAQEEAEFDRKWAEGITVEEARKRTLAFIDTLKWDK